MEASLRVLGGLLIGRQPSAVDPREVPWERVTYPVAQRLRGLLVEAGWATATVNRHLAALRGVLNEARKLGYIKDAQFIDDVKSVAGNASETGRALGPDEVKRLYAACDQTPRGRRDAAIFGLALGGGLRRVEVCRLDLANWERDSVQVLGKRNKWRRVFLTKAAIAAVESWLVVRGNAPGPLVCSISKHNSLEHGNRLTEGGVYYVLQQLAERAKVASFTPHDLRRTYITSMLSRGADALTVSKLAGHAQIQTTLRYDKRAEKEQKAAVALLDDEPEVDEPVDSE